MVYSNGAMCHIEEKEGILKECYRVLSPNGTLVINDWLSPTKGEWRGHVNRLIELDGLSLFAETVEGYLKRLTGAQFTGVAAQDVTDQYADLNEAIVDCLKAPLKREELIGTFGEPLYFDAVETYDVTAKAMRAGDLLVYQFTASKK